MKRNILILLLLLVLAVALAACGGDKSDEGTSAPTTEPTTVPSDPTPEPTVPTTEPSAPSTEPSDPSTEPDVPAMPEYVTWTEYVPGTIKLVPQKSDDFSFERKYRYIYYGYCLHFVNLLSDEQRADWWEFSEEDGKRTNYGEYQEEMVLVTMIKRYNIPKEAFQKVVNKCVQIEQKLGLDLMCERDEIPNADIIYTFDNEIINRFYRYE